MKLNEIISFPHEQMTLCICNPIPTNATFPDLRKCQQKDCETWLHRTCFGCHYCPYCCLDWIDDPFFETDTILISPKMVSAFLKKVSAKGEYHWTPIQDRCVRKEGHQVRVWCFNSRAAVGRFQIEWPGNCTVEVNGSRLLTKPGEYLTIPDSKIGHNIVCLHGYPVKDQIFCFGVSLVKSVTLQEVSGRVVVEPEQEARKRCAQFPNNDVEMLSAQISLVCPLTRLRIQNPARFTKCGHLFDLLTYLQHTQASAEKWVCPVCIKKFSFMEMISDGFLKPICSSLAENVSKIEMEVDGSWRMIYDEGVGESAVLIISSSDEEEVEVGGGDGVIDEVGGGDGVIDEVGGEGGAVHDSLHCLRQYGSDSE